MLFTLSLGLPTLLCSSRFVFYFVCVFGAGVTSLIALHSPPLPLTRLCVRVCVCLSLSHTPHPLPLFLFVTSLHSLGGNSGIGDAGCTAMADALKGNTTAQLLGWEEGRKDGWMDGRGLVWLFVQVERERERERERSRTSTTHQSCSCCFGFNPLVDWMTAASAWTARAPSVPPFQRTDSSDYCSGCASCYC